MDFTPEQPWPLSECQDGYFYHSMDFPDGTSVRGHWDIRGHFENYIGHYGLAGKSVLDVGTATGFLAFSAERAGARVTALDVRNSAEFRRIPFHDSPYHCDRAQWTKDYDEQHVRLLKKAFWYSWHKLNSNVEVIYAPLDQLCFWDRRFDVVLAGAVLEHLSDPISAIGAFARLAKEAVVIAFTDVVDTDECVMQPVYDLSEPRLDYGWWKLSRGLYRQVFDNLGFTIEIAKTTAFYTPWDDGLRGEVTRPTIIARKKSPEQMALPRVKRAEMNATIQSSWRSRLRRLLPI